MLTVFYYPVDSANLKNFITLLIRNAPSILVSADFDVPDRYIGTSANKMALTDPSGH